MDEPSSGPSPFLAPGADRAPRSAVRETPTVRPDANGTASGRSAEVVASAASAPAMPAIAPMKLCTQCGHDLSAVKRIKDRLGRYFCAACWDDLATRRRQAAEAQAAAPAPSRSTQMVVCAYCKKPMPESLARFYNGDIACDRCAQQQAQEKTFALRQCKGCGGSFTEDHLYERGGITLCQQCFDEKQRYQPKAAVEPEAAAAKVPKPKVRRRSIFRGRRWPQLSPGTYMMRGAVFTIVGLAITFASYQWANANHHNHYVIAIGALSIGPLMFLRGLFGYISGH